MKIFKIADWLYNRELGGSHDYKIQGKIRENKRKYGTSYCGYSKFFTEKDILRVTEKAYQIKPKMQLECEIDENEYIKQKMWVAKSQIEEVDTEYGFDYFQNLENNFNHNKEINDVIEIYFLKQVANIEKLEDHAIFYKAIDKKNENNYFIFETYYYDLIENI